MTNQLDPEVLLNYYSQVLGVPYDYLESQANEILEMTLNTLRNSGLVIFTSSPYRAVSGKPLTKDQIIEELEVTNRTFLNGQLSREWLLREYIREKEED